MLQTLFYIPEQLFGYPMFGAGLLLAVWGMASLVLLAWLVRRQGWIADTWGYVPLLLAIGAVIWFLLPKIAEPGFGLPIRGYGTMLLIAFLSGTALVAWRGYRLGIHPDVSVSLVFWGFIPGIIGARVYYVATHSHEFHSLGEMINITQGGLVVYGSLIGGVLGFGAFLVKHKLPLLPMLDILTPGMLLGLALGRIGCLLNGCCYGGECDLPWAVRFPVGSPPFVQQVEEGKIALYGLRFQGPKASPPVIADVEPDSPASECGLKPGQTLSSVNGVPTKTISHAQWALVNGHRFGETMSIGVAGAPRAVQMAIPAHLPRTRPVHPTQLYSSIDALVLCLFLLAYDPFKRRDGVVFALFLSVYPVNRFLMECIRTDEPGIWGTPLTGAQFLSLAILAVVCGLWWYILRQPAGKLFSAQAA